jgi:hypothetical protein
VASSIHRAGQQVPKTGIYKAIHLPHRDADQENTWLTGQFFPYCPQCDDLVEYMLIYAAPGPDEDPDLAKPPKTKTAKP